MAKKMAPKSPVYIHEHGRPAYVLLTIEEYRKLTGESVNIIDLLAMPGVAEFDFELIRANIQLPLALDDFISQP